MFTPMNQRRMWKEGGTFFTTKHLYFGDGVTAVDSPCTQRVVLGRTSSPPEAELSCGCTLMSTLSHLSSMETSHSSSAADMNHISECQVTVMQPCSIDFWYLKESLVLMLNMKSDRLLKHKIVSKCDLNVHASGQHQSHHCW